MAGQITRYLLAWHTRKDIGTVLIEVDGGRKIKLPFSNPAEFAAVAAVLRESPVFFSDDGLIRTGVEVVEDWESSPDDAGAA